MNPLLWAVSTATPGLVAAAYYFGSPTPVQYFFFGAASLLVARLPPVEQAALDPSNILWTLVNRRAILGFGAGFFAQRYAGQSFGIAAATGVIAGLAAVYVTPMDKALYARYKEFAPGGVRDENNRAWPSVLDHDAGRNRLGLNRRSYFNRYWSVTTSDAGFQRELSKSYP